jgi:hypothetical protein
LSLLIHKEFSFSKNFNLFLFVKNQSQTQPLLKTPPAVLQPIAPQTTFGVQAQPQPQSLLQAQISAASITPLLQTQPQPLLQQPQQKGIAWKCLCFLFQTIIYIYIYLVAKTLSMLLIIKMTGTSREHGMKLKCPQ